MGPNISNVEILKDYCLKIFFEDGQIAILDMEPYLKKELYQELKDMTLFKKFEIYYDTIRWPNGADIAPELILSKTI